MFCYTIIHVAHGHDLFCAFELRGTYLLLHSLPRFAAGANVHVFDIICCAVFDLHASLSWQGVLNVLAYNLYAVLLRFSVGISLYLFWVALLWRPLCVRLIRVLGFSGVRYG